MNVSQVCMGPVPWEPVFNLQTLETFHDTFRPIQDTGRPMGPVPYLSLMLVWDQSHVLLHAPYGTGPIKYMGLQNKEIQNTSMTTFNKVVP